MRATKGRTTWDENHERLYDAALRHIERVGLNDVRIERICEETKLSRPTFYAHFQNKDCVVSELLCRFMDGIARGLEAYASRPCDLEGVIDELVRLSHDANARTPERIRRELAASLPRQYENDLFANSPVYTILSRAIVEAAKRQNIRPVSDPRGLARRIAVLVNGFFMAHPNAPERAAREARETLGFVLQGLRRA